MQNDHTKLALILVLIGMLLSSCAANSSSVSQDAMAAPEPPKAPAAVEAPTAEASSMAAKEARRQYEIGRNRFMYEDIFFAKNKYQLDDQARERLNWKAAWLQAHPQVKVVIEGHCGEGGHAERNMALGLRRAGEVKGYLLRQGVARERLTAVSYGSERPIAQGKGEDVQAKNRRVRLTVSEE